MVAEDFGSWRGSMKFQNPHLSRQTHSLHIKPEKTLHHMSWFTKLPLFAIQTKRGAKRQWLLHLSVLSKHFTDTQYCAKGLGILGVWISTHHVAPPRSLIMPTLIMQHDRVINNHPHKKEGVLHQMVPTELSSHGVSVGLQGETKETETAKIYRRHLKQPTCQVP